MEISRLDISPRLQESQGSDSGKVVLKDKYKLARIGEVGWKAHPTIIE